MSDILLLAQADPTTGFDSPLWQIVILMALLASLVTLVRAWRQHRRR